MKLDEIIDAKKKKLKESVSQVDKIVMDMIEFEAQVEDDDHFHTVYKNYMDGHADKDRVVLKAKVMAAYKAATDNYKKTPEQMAKLRYSNINEDDYWGDQRLWSDDEDSKDERQ